MVGKGGKLSIYVFVWSRKNSTRNSFSGREPWGKIKHCFYTKNHSLILN